MSSDNPFSEYAPGPIAEGEEFARLALWVSIESERRRRRRSLRVSRITVLAFSIFMAWSVGPSQIGGNRLVGLADAVAGAGPGGPALSVVWYEKTNAFEAHDVPADILQPLQIEGFRFVVPTVTEMWLAPDGVVRTQVTYGQPVFGPGVDERVFDWLRLADRYPVGAVVERLGTEEPEISLPWEEGAEAVGEVMKRHAEASGNKRPVSVQMLDMSLELFREERGVPTRRAVLFRVLATVSGLQVVDHQGNLMIVARYVEDDDAYEKRVVIDRNNGVLISHEVVRLATDNAGEDYLTRQLFLIESDRTGALDGAS